MSANPIAAQVMADQHRRDLLADANGARLARSARAERTPTTPPRTRALRWLRRALAQ